MQTGLFQLIVARESANCHFSLSNIESRLMLRSMLCMILLVIFTYLPVVEAGTLPEYDRVRILSSPLPITDTELIDHHGQPFRLSALRGRVVLIFFGFTNCPDVCPTGMANLRELAKSNQLASGKIAYVMVSVDGERDTPAVMKAYVQSFSPGFIGLTGEPAQVKKMAKNFSVAFFKGSSDTEGGGYSVAHSPQIFALDPDGRLRAEFYNASIPAMAGVTAAILNEAQASSGNADEQ